MRKFRKTIRGQFVELVKTGAKRQTVRPAPKRPQDRPQPGDELTLARWTGRPYRSKQEVIGRFTVAEVCDVGMSETGLYVREHACAGPERDAFARADGFAGGFGEMAEWFGKVHGLPFKGILIRWTDLAPSPGVRRKHARTVFGRLRVPVGDRLFVFELRRAGLAVREYKHRKDRATVVPFSRLAGATEKQPELFRI